MVQWWHRKSSGELPVSTASIGRRQLGQMISLLKVTGIPCGLFLSGILPKTRRPQSFRYPIGTKKGESIVLALIGGGYAFLP